MTEAKHCALYAQEPTEPASSTLAHQACDGAGWKQRRRSREVAMRLTVSSTLALLIGTGAAFAGSSCLPEASDSAGVRDAEIATKSGPMLAIEATICNI
jgi:hypothetical protein